MSRPILICLGTILKYQFFGLKATADSAFYNLVTLKPILGLFDVLAFASLIVHTFIALPLAFLFNMSVLALVWVFDRNSYDDRLKLVEKGYNDGADQIKTQYQAYVDSLG